jgi:hypothetical protein
MAKRTHAEARLPKIRSPAVRALRKQIGLVATAHVSCRVVKDDAQGIPAAAADLADAVAQVNSIGPACTAHGAMSRYLDDIQVTIAFSVTSLVGAWPSCKHMHMLAACTHTLCLPLEPHGCTMTKAESEAKALESRPSPTRAQPWAVGQWRRPRSKTGGSSSDFQTANGRSVKSAHFNGRPRPSQYRDRRRRRLRTWRARRTYSRQS